MWLRTLILLTLAISAFGQAMLNRNGERIVDTVRGEIYDEWDDCKNARAEIVFIIDGSRSIPQIDFNKQITFLKSFVDHFEIGKNGMRFGAVTFGDKIIKDNTFGLTQYASKDQLKNGISNIDFKPDDGDSTETYLAIKYAHGIIFKDARPDIKKIAIVITDGQSTAPNKTAEQAMKMRKEGILIFAIGVGKDVSEEELHTITGRNDYVFMVDKYSLLKTVRTELRKLTCNSDKVHQMVACLHLSDEEFREKQGCRGMVDINFVFDSSVMGYEDTRNITTFIKKSVTDEYLDNKKVLFGMITGKCQALKDFYLNTYQTRTEIMKHLDIFHKTSIVSLLQKVKNVSTMTKYGARNRARKVAVIFLKGKLSEPQGVITNAKVLSKNGIEVFVIKMDDLNSENTLTSITRQRNILDATEIKSMVQLSSEFLNRLCKR
ncbi:Hypothetical predicted protein [Octopus vulgaris]|uniref:VWFA domain-containing protein n=1 Tax=Octopus vulgaris TaxID=6645 RepID=A0AA36BV64_OCTVU|nr:Hypothetical predicted protein [Octopus vulgaris]